MRAVARRDEDRRDEVVLPFPTDRRQEGLLKLRAAGMFQLGGVAELGLVRALLSLGVFSGSVDVAQRLLIKSCKKNGKMWWEAFRFERQSMRVTRDGKTRTVTHWRHRDTPCAVSREMLADFEKYVGGHGSRNGRPLFVRVGHLHGQKGATVT